MHTGLKFELAAQDVHEKLDNSIHWCQSVREQEESNHDGLLVEETERLVQRLVVDEDREERKDVEHVRLQWSANFLIRNRYEEREKKTYLSNTKQLGGVAQTPVTKFVTKNSNNLIRLTLFNQSVVDDNVLFPG